MSGFTRRLQQAVRNVPYLSAWPDATNTGWQPTGVTLQTLTDSSSGSGWYCDNSTGNPTLYVTADGTVLDGLDIYGRYLHIMANNVTVKRCRIYNGGYYCMFIGDLPTTYSGLTVEDCEIDGTGDTTDLTICINDSEDATFLRCNIHGMASSGPRIGSGNLIQDCWLHDYFHGTDGHEAGMSSNGSESNVTIRHNSISIDTEGASSCLAFYRDSGNPSDFLVENNLLNGGNYGVMCGIEDSADTYPPIDNMQFIDNVFGRELHPECGVYGPQAQFSSTNGTGNVWSGNTWGGGAAATGTHAIGDPVLVS